MKSLDELLELQLPPEGRLAVIDPGEGKQDDGEAWLQVVMWHANSGVQCLLRREQVVQLVDVLGEWLVETEPEIPGRPS